MLLGGYASGPDVAGGAVEVGSDTSVAGEGSSLTLGAGDSEAIQGGSVEVTSGQAGSGVDGASSGSVSMTSASLHRAEMRCFPLALRNPDLLES